jgi:hypothetical protein
MRLTHFADISSTQLANLLCSYAWLGRISNPNQTNFRYWHLNFLLLNTPHARGSMKSIDWGLAPAASRAWASAPS